MSHYRCLKIENSVYEYRVSESIVVIRSPVDNKKITLSPQDIGKIRKTRYCDCGSMDCLAHGLGWQVCPSDIRKWVLENWYNNTKQPLPKLIKKEGQKPAYYQHYLIDQKNRSEKKKSAALLAQRREEYRKIYGNSNQSKYSYSVCDPKNFSGYPELVEYMPVIKEGFILWYGEKREVREVHKTYRGIQIELID